MACNHEHDTDTAYLREIVDHMAQRYCTGMDIPSAIITVHAHETGTHGDRLLTVHIATGPESTARLALQAVVSDVAAHVHAAHTPRNGS